MICGANGLQPAAYASPALPSRTAISCTARYLKKLTEFAASQGLAAWWSIQSSSSKYGCSDENRATCFRRKISDVGIITCKWPQQCMWNCKVHGFVGTHHCCVYTVKLLMTDKLSETCRVLFQNKLEKLVHLVGCTIRIYHDARSPERQKGLMGLGN